MGHLPQSRLHNEQQGAETIQRREFCEKISEFKVALGTAKNEAEQRGITAEEVRKNRAVIVRERAKVHRGLVMLSPRQRE